MTEIELLLAGIAELQRVRGRLGKVTVADVENMLAVFPAEKMAHPTRAASIVEAIDRLTAEVKALRAAQEQALRLAQGTVVRAELPGEPHG